MAKAEIGVYLAAHFNDFKNGLAKAAAEVKTFKDKAVGMTSGFTSMTGAVGKLVPAIGALSGGIEIFKGVLDSSQALTDAWGRTLESAESVTKSFFVTLSSGNFSGFIGGLSTVIDKAKNAYDAIDRLGSIDIFASTDVGEYEIRQEELELAIKRKKKNGQDTSAEQAELKELEQKMIDYYSNMQSEFHAAEKRVARAVIAKYAQGQFTDEQLDKAADTYLKNFSNYDSIVAKLDELRRLEMDLNLAQQSATAEEIRANQGVYVDEEGKLQRQIDLTTHLGRSIKALEDYKEALGGEDMIKLVRAIDKADDESLKKIMQIRQQYQAQRKAAISAQKKDLELIGGGGAQDNTDALNKKLLDSENALQIAKLGNIQDRELRELEIARTVHEQKLAMLKDEYDKAKTWQDKLAAFNKIQAENISYGNQLNDKLGVSNPVINPLTTISEEAVIQQMREVMQVVQDNIDPLEIEIDTDKFKDDLNDVASAMSALGSAWSNLGTAFESESLNIAGIMAESIANIIKGYAAASASAGKSGNPWAWAAFTLSGLAEVTSVISQVKSISKYADGGIISGSTTVGDRQLARVNSGEMILNSRQQASLFRQLNQGAAMASAPASRQVEFTVRGSELVGVLNNYNTFNH